MTQMRAHESFENSALVEAWLKEPTLLEPVDEGRVATIVHHTPQARRWPPQVDLGRFAPMFNATRFVAASVVLALTGGLLFTALPTEPTPVGPIPPGSETATETADTIEPIDSLITLPDELPEGVESGTIDTPAGPARWVHVADRESVPLPWITDVMPWGDGIAAFAGVYTTMASTQDGVNWESIDLPEGDGPGMEISLIDDTYVAVSPSGRAWTSTGAGGEWRELDTTAVVPALESGWPKGNVGALAPTQVDGRTVFAIRYSYSLPRQMLGIRKQKTNAKMKRLSSDRYALCGNGSCKNGGQNATWKLRFEETPKGLRVFDDTTGRRLGLIAGASLDDLYEGREAVGHRAFAIEGDSVVWIDSPWPMDPGWSPPGRGGQTVETVPPPDAPRSDRLSWIGNAWLAQKWSSEQAANWLHLGGAWHSLDDMCGREGGCSVAGLGNVTLLLGGQGGLWVLLHPAGE